MTVSRFYNRGKWLQRVATGTYGYLPHGDSDGRRYGRTPRKYKRKPNKHQRELMRDITRKANALADRLDSL